MRAESVPPSLAALLVEPFRGWRGWMVPLCLTLVLAAASRHNFALFHTLSELFAIMVAVILAVVAWHTYAFSRNHYLMYLGVGYFWIGILDLLHTLTFQGVDLIPAANADTSIQFWILTRYFEAFVLLSSPLFFRRRVYPVGLLLGFGAVTAVITYAVSSGTIPSAYDEQQGLTRFKVLSEYFIIALLLTAALLLAAYRTYIDRRIYQLMVMSILLTVCAELAFTLYRDAHSLPAFVGHILKLLSFWLIYLAVVRTTLTEPFQVMAHGSSTYDAIPDATILVDKAGHIRQLNQAAARMVGRAANDIIGRHCHALFHAADTSVEECVICQHIRSSQRLTSYELYLDERAQWREYSLTPFGSSSDLRGIVQVSSNITARKQAEEELIRQANYDQLTHLPNRALAMDRLLMAMSRASHGRRRVAVLFIDIDNFKNINESLGHRVGDRLLLEIAERLRHTLHEDDTLARWAGDEFVAVLPDIEDPGRAKTTAEAILNAVVHPVNMAQRELIVSASIGIAVFPDDAQVADILVSNADTAMHRAKHTGKHTYRFFTPEMNRGAAQRLEMESQLRHAIQREELYPVYQPQLDLKTRAIVGCEALMRWESPVLGNVPPDRFIPMAEETGLITSMGEWMLQRVLRDMSTLYQQLGRHIGVSVNISSCQLRDPGFPDKLRTILQDSELQHRDLILEITESMLIEDDDVTMECLDVLIQMGMRLSMDDFGTGYSSLSYLKKFPFSELKIDRGFVRDITIDPGDAALCTAIIAMARGLGIKVVGEGVETEDQCGFLRDHGAEIGQGYLFSKPVPINDLLRYIRRTEVAEAPGIESRS